MNETQTEFCRRWILEHLEPQTDRDNLDLTWYCSVYAPFRKYIAAADRMGFKPFQLIQFEALIKMQYPVMRTKMLQGVQVFTGIRFYEDRIGGKLVFGV